MPAKNRIKEQQLARSHWDRYTYAMTRGHREYQSAAKENEWYYLGRGLQWDPELKHALEAQGRPWLEENVIFSTVNTVLGYQTQSRMDIAYKPREAVDQETSDVLTKLAMFIIDQNKYPWLESEMFADGVIQQRGYIDMRIEFDDNMYGDIKMERLDPLDVIPDPDSKSYNPDDWGDVTVTSWIPVDDIKTTYGLAKWRQVNTYLQDNNQPDFGSDGWGEVRNSFADPIFQSSYFTDESGINHVRVIERQWWKLQNREFWFDIETGDYFPIPDEMKEREKKQIAKANEYDIIKRLVKRIRWTVSTYDSVLHDDWSPYDHFTIIPYFPYFRRGRTRGLVDNLISTQDMLNKTYSQILHIVNTTANSGWTVEENSLTNMDTEDLEDVGAKTGLVVEHKRGTTPPTKIEPNPIPQGLKDLVGSAVDLIRLISGVSETFQGGKGPEVSGTAIQSRVQQSAVQLATPIDNLFRTRNMIGERMLKLLQKFYTEERVFLIAEDETSEGEGPSEVVANQELDDGSVINDITVGKYDVVIADVPTQITFQGAQFQQALDMRKFGVNIPDDEMVLMSTLTRKRQIAEKISSEPSEQEQELLQKQMEQLEAEIEKLKADRNKTQMDAVKSAADSAKVITEAPTAAPLMDELLNSQDAQGDEEEEEEIPEVQELGPQEQSLGNFQGPPVV